LSRQKLLLCYNTFFNLLYIDYAFCQMKKILIAQHIYIFTLQKFDKKHSQKNNIKCIMRR
jgi:hypothetical protein